MTPPSELVALERWPPASLLRHLKYPVSARAAARAPAPSTAVRYRAAAAARAASRTSDQDTKSSDPGFVQVEFFTS